MNRSLALVLVAPLIVGGLSACGRRAVAPVPPAGADPNVIVLSTAAQRTAGIVVETVQTHVRTDTTEAPGLLAVDETRTAERDWEGFELLAAACSYCCTQYTGGNKDCPPKPLAE